jgi:GNAT superfamily N-acetyltransferase
MLVTAKMLAVRAMRADLVYTVQRMQVIAGREGPFGVAIKTFGTAMGLAAAGLPSSRFNRVVGLTPTETTLLPEILAWYAELGPSPRIEIRPGDLSDGLADALARAGFRQTSFQASLVGEVAETPPTDIAIRSVETSEMMERFLDVYLAGWGFPLAIHEGAKANMRGWLGLPGWHLYLAEIDAQAAATAVSFLHESVAYFADACVHPNFRGRRLQSALLAHYKRDAARLGADLLCSQAIFASTSHRNIERAGLRVLHTQAECDEAIKSSHQGLAKGFSGRPLYGASRPF